MYKNSNAILMLQLIKKFAYKQETEGDKSGDEEREDEEEEDIIQEEEEKLQRKQNTSDDVIERKSFLW